MDARAPPAHNPTQGDPDHGTHTHHPDALEKGDGARSHTPATRPSTAPAPASIVRRKIVSMVAASGLDYERDESFFGPARRDTRVAGDLVAAMVGLRPQLLIDAAEAILRFDRPTLLIWGRIPRVAAARAGSR
jgi:hypothetical protein